MSTVTSSLDRSTAVGSMIGLVIRRPRREATPPPALVVEVQKAPSEAVMAPRGWKNLHGEIVGEMRQLGADPSPLRAGTRRWGSP